MAITTAMMPAVKYILFFIDPPCDWDKQWLQKSQSHIMIMCVPNCLFRLDRAKVLWRHTALETSLTSLWKILLDCSWSWPRPHTGLLGQHLISVWRHLPKICYLQHHSETDLSEPVFVVIDKLNQGLFLFFCHWILVQHTSAYNLFDSQHTISHTVNSEIQIVTSALQRL